MSALLRFYGAWTGPGSPPPEGNAPAPINVGPDSQTKAGSLFLGGVLRTLENLSGNLVLSGSNGVAMSNSSWYGYNYPGGGYSSGSYYILGSPNPISYVFDLPGDNCDVFVGSTQISGATMSGLYSYSGSQPKNLSFGCANVVPKITKTIILKDSSGNTNPGDFSGQIFLPTGNCNLKISIGSLGGSSSMYEAQWWTGGSMGTNHDSSAAIMSVKFNGVVLYPSNGQAPVFGSIDNSTYNNLIANLKTNLNIDVNNIASGKKSLEVNTMWIHRYQSKANGVVTIETYSVDPNGFGAPGGTPGVSYVAAAYECQ